MKSFESGFIERQPITHGILQTICLLGEYKGKEALYQTQNPQSLETLRAAAVIQSTESSNRIEGVVASFKRIQALIAKKTTPKNRSEQEIAGYRDVLNTIHANATHMSFSPNVVLQLHRHLYRYAATQGGTWKSVDNDITQVQPDGTVFVRFRPSRLYQ